MASVYRPKNDVRFITATSLFDGHDAAINIMRRLLQGTGAEVIHLGHNCSVEQIVTAAIQEGVQGIAVSSYQGGHMEFFRYMVDSLEARGCGHIQIFGGGGGTIIPEEIKELQAYGVARLYDPEDGRRMGLQGMINEMVERCDHSMLDFVPESMEGLSPQDWNRLAQAITLAEYRAQGLVEPERYAALVRPILEKGAQRQVPIIGFTGTGGAGKSSLVDELLHRYQEDCPDHQIAILSVDPTKRKTGGALLGDRIRMNAVYSGNVFLRSLATRGSGKEISAALGEAIALCKGAGFDLLIAETSGIGQADASIVELVNHSVYVMTPEFGAQTQLEKIDMIDLADLVVVNKFDKAGALDALRDVRKAYQRAHERFHDDLESMPVFATISSQFNDFGVNAVYAKLLEFINTLQAESLSGSVLRKAGLPERHHIIAPKRVRYLGEVADCVRHYKQSAHVRGDAMGRLWALRTSIAHLLGDASRVSLEPFDELAVSGQSVVLAGLMQAFNELHNGTTAEDLELVGCWPSIERQYRSERTTYEVRGRTIEVENTRESLSRKLIPKVALPRFREWGSLLEWLRLENLPGFFPFTAGVFPFKRDGEDPTRMFAGEGGPWRTNKRFHYLSRHAVANRLSTAFDSVTLYGEDPDRRLDIWGKIGNSGVSIATVEDMEALYAGFDLVEPKTSVSMTINGPAPAMLAFFFNTAVRQQLRRHLKRLGKIELSEADCLQPGGGGYSFDALRALVDDDTYKNLVKETVAKVRGTVQADILKEDQAQNTCIFSTEFALKLMGDVQAWFNENGVRNFYSVSISGYHIAEAGANPISQLAFTLANGFTLVEYYIARGMKIDEFAPNLSFFFSNGMDPEYAVIGRVARRIWAVAMRDLYGANERSQKLKYHIQTSGRSLHAQEVDFNDIRTTLQALLGIYDNCNSLHTNAYDEAVTTPTEASVRRALAIQLIINQEFGVAKNENPNQGSFIIDELTELVESAVLDEFDRLTERGGVLGAMERMYQRSKIQEESLYYEGLKHSGALPIIGVNTFEGQSSGGETTLDLSRSSDEEKEDQLQRLVDFHARHAQRAPAAAERLKRAALQGENVFAELMQAVEVMSLGQVSKALYKVGGQYRRSM